MKTAVQKGKILEKYVADQIREKGIDPKAYPSHGSGNGNSEKGDIWTSMMVLGQNAGIECKNQAVLKIQDWWRQTKKLESLRREPILVFHVQHEPIEETKVVIYLDTFLELVKSQTFGRFEVTGEDEKTREKKWAVNNAVVALKKVLKFYE
jgi:hypothetical protein